MDLSYIKTNREIVFVNCKNSVNLITERPIQYPRYMSWNGFNSWIKTIRYHFDLTYEQAYVALLSPHRSIDWVLKLPEKILRKITDTITPFNEYCNFSPEEIIYWYKNLYRIASLKEYFNNKLLIEVIKPTTREDIEKIKEMGPYFTNKTIDKYEINLKKLKPCGWLNRPIEEVLILSVTGCLKPKLVKICNKLSIKDSNIWDIEWLNKYQDRIDPDYIKPNADISLETAIKMGLKPVEILDYGYPKKICNEIISRSLDLGWNDIRVSSMNKMFALYQYKDIVGFPKEWDMECNNKEVVDWAMNHLPQLRKSRRVYGPAGKSRIFHYHEILKYMTPNMLTNGPKTGWKKIMDLIEKKVTDQIEHDLGVYKEFRKLNIPKMKGVEQITNTDALRMEGELMNHCIGGYVKACISDISHIFHVGDKAPKGATAEICYKDKQYVLQQIWGYGNKYPSKDEKELALSLVNVLNETSK